MKNPPVPEQIKLWFLGTFAIIVSAVKIPFRNPNFITFTLITSIPLFFIKLIPRLPYIQNQLINLFIDALIQLNILTVTYKTINTKHLINVSWAVEPITQFLKVYLVDLVNFLTALTTIYASSTIHTSNGDHKASMGLRDLLKNSVTQTRWRDPVFKFIAMSILCNIFLPDVLYWINAQSLLSSWCGNSFILKALHFIVLAVAFAKCVEYTAWWNLTLVVSILELEEQRGFQAFSTSSQLMNGNKLRGCVLMLLLYPVRISFNRPTRMCPKYCSELGYAISCCDLTGRSFRNEDIAYEYFIASLLCLRTVMTWMVYTIYYFDCKNREQRRRLTFQSL